MLPLADVADALVRGEGAVTVALALAKLAGVHPRAIRALALAVELVVLELALVPIAVGRDEDAAAVALPRPT